MSEKLYAWLLRLYPRHFRETYGEAALQLFRDRSRDEKGLIPGLRLWLDLLADLAISLPREYRHVRPALAGASVQKNPYGELSFRVLEGESPRPGALVLGAVVSVIAVVAWGPIVHLAHSRSEHSRSEHSRSEKQDAPRAMKAAMLLNTGTERQRVVRAVIANLKRYYVDRDVAEKMADALSAHDERGDYDSVTDGAELADLLTKQMRDVSGDMNLIVVYSRDARPDRRPGFTPESIAAYRKAMQQSNCTFEKVEILDHNIGYLKLNSFPDVSVCQSAAEAAMASLNQTDAIIFDLRDNRGGYPNMVALIAAYLFDHPEYLYNPRENTTERSWTQSPVPGNRLADKPVYVLTSARTLSGAEQFSFDLKMLKRATLVGETTGGAAHAGTYHRIDDHFGMGITETKAINPFSRKNWDGTGVEPDVKMRAADALESAKKLAGSTGASFRISRERAR